MYKLDIKQLRKIHTWLEIGNDHEKHLAVCYMKTIPFSKLKQVSILFNTFEIEQRVKPLPLIEVNSIV